MKGRKLSIGITVCMLFCLLAVSCREKPVEEKISESYVKKAGSIYYKDGDKLKKLQEADVSSFRPLAEDIAKDRNTVYFQQFRQSGVDRVSFTVTPNGALKDKNHVYLRVYNDTLAFRILYNVDRASYDLYKGRSKWAYDRGHVYYDFSRPVEVDRRTFSFLNSVFMKDKNYLYYMAPHDSLIKKKADIRYLVSLNDFYVRDGSRIYFIDGNNFDKIDEIPFHEVRSIRLWGEAYLSVDGKLYFSGNLVDGGRVDLKRFRKISGVYYTDGHSVYCEGNAVKGADLKTFRPLSDFMAKDRNSVYYWERKMQGVDAVSFEPVNVYYIKDKRHVYFIYGRPEEKDFFFIVKGADPASFRINEKKGPAFGKDKKYEFYYGGMIIQE